MSVIPKNPIFPNPVLPKPSVYLFRLMFEQRPDEPDPVQLVNLDQSGLILGASAQSRADVDQQFRVICGNKFDEWCQTVLLFDGGHIGLVPRAFGDGPNHVGQHPYLLGVELEVIQGVAVLLQDLGQHTNQAQFLGFNVHFLLFRTKF